MVQIESYRNYNRNKQIIHRLKILIGVFFVVGLILLLIPNSISPRKSRMGTKGTPIEMNTKYSKNGLYRLDWKPFSHNCSGLWMDWIPEEASEKLDRVEVIVMVGDHRVRPENIIFRASGFYSGTRLPIPICEEETVSVYIRWKTESLASFWIWSIKANECPQKCWDRAEIAKDCLFGTFFFWTAGIALIMVVRMRSEESRRSRVGTV
eukprot:TRINITY_DN4941_c0_g1_i1.p1 TRINITY_DN4941_c0_g1~~TRINITY_DN4941_c0_g1_i1.p1  ORF type:complete len:208 (+),score=36.70 TRINITY_DN4941_c0_g1_i1:52-675(+)